MALQRRRHKRRSSCSQTNKRLVELRGKEVDSSLLKDEKSNFHLKMTAELLMCDHVALEDALLKRVIGIPEEVIKRSLNPKAVTISRDGLATTLYCGLFDSYSSMFISGNFYCNFDHYCGPEFISTG
nr:myosin-9-like isoform X2 [Tanacetum cinerariifolium]